MEVHKDQQRTVELPETLYELMECQEPAKTPTHTAHPQYQLFDDDELPIIVTKQDFAWLLGRTLSRSSASPIANTHDTREPLQHSTNVPVWSAYNSVIHQPLDVTRRAVPPLIPLPAHEWSTLLTVLQQAQKNQHLCPWIREKDCCFIRSWLLPPRRETSNGAK